MDQRELTRINQWLTNNYGRADGILSNYRLIWGPDEWEVRKGKFAHWLGNIFLSEIEEMRRVRKYLQFDDCYILEKLVPVNKTIHEEELTLPYSYEPIWAYTKKDKDGNRMDPDLAAIQFFMKMAVEGPKLTADWCALQDALEVAREVAYYEDIFSNEAPLLAYGGGVSVDGTRDSVNDLTVEENKEIKSNE